VTVTGGALREVDEHAFYPVWERGVRLIAPEHERQVRYLRDALSVPLPRCEVTGGTAVLGWDGEETSYTIPDVLAWRYAGRHEAADPHPNRHPGEIARRFELAVDVNEGEPRDAEELLIYGFGAYVHFNPRRGAVTALRLVNGEGVPVREDDGRFTFADEQVSFSLDADRFLWLHAWDGSKMPRYDEVVATRPSPLGGTR
jgi:hypothetical protein